MTVTTPRLPPNTPAPERCLDPGKPLVFPPVDAEEMGETTRHLALRTAIWQALQLGFAERLATGSDQFVYYDGNDPTACCAPDVFVCLGKAQTAFETWKTWEQGTPELAIEIASASDARDRSWNEKLARYRELGVCELVRFDPDDGRQPLRIWDRVQDDLVERDPADPGFPHCNTLDAFFCLRNDARYGLWLYLARDREGRDPYPTEAEARQRETEARERAEAEVRRLRAEIAKRDAAR
jgi:Uma2 family endonuclease